jgi:hypothetical protein
VGSSGLNDISFVAAGIIPISAKLFFAQKKCSSFKKARQGINIPPNHLSNNLALMGFIPARIPVLLLLRAGINAAPTRKEVTE